MSDGLARGPDTIVVFGPSAVGKMTVGRLVADQLGYRLFHNHQVIDLILPYFDYGHPSFGPLLTDLRSRMFREFRAGGLKGLVFTYVWALNQPSDHDEIRRYLADLGVDPAQARYVELAAGQDERLRRNQLPDRLAAKPSKRNLTASEHFIKAVEPGYQLNTEGSFFYPNRHVKVETEGLTAEETANRVLAALAALGA